MLKTFALAVMLVVLMAHQPLEAVTPVFKCTIDGKISYQSVPCPTGERRDTPSVDALNAERQNRLRQAGSTPSMSSTVVTPIALPVDTFKCDGRIHCSQMTTCSEAKYFLKNCPGVKMDGDRDGIPCEEQWCNK